MSIFDHFTIFHIIIDPPNTKNCSLFLLQQLKNSLNFAIMGKKGEFLNFRYDLDTFEFYFFGKN